MKTLKSLGIAVLLLTLCTSFAPIISNNGHSFAYASVVRNDKNILYLSMVQTQRFIHDYDFTTDTENISSEMKRQFTEYLQYQKEVSEEIQFEGYYMLSKKSEAESRWKEVKENYKSKDYKIELVKEFSYD